MLAVKGISFSYDAKITLKNIHFTLAKGKHLSIMGESGCGKSTLLKAIYGLLSLNSGTITYNGETLLGPEYHLVPGHPFMKYLSQDFNLMPYISAAQNVGTFLSNFYPKKKKQRIRELLDVVGMRGHAETHVRYLSGGQQQRIALARVLANEPEVLLLDEPFSQIDNFKKNELRNRLFGYLNKEGITCITATHDKDDVLAYADAVIVLKDGEKLAESTPKQLYMHPNNFYITSLFTQVNRLDVSIFNTHLAEKFILIYPHEMKVAAKSTLQGAVQNCYFKGAYYELHVIYKDQVIVVHSKKAFAEGKKVGLTCAKKILETREAAC